MADTYRVVYGVHLLDDLHNYFPSLLYTPQLFRTVPDVLTYIQQRTLNRFNLFAFGNSLFMEANSPQAAAGRPSPVMRPRGGEPETPIVETNFSVEFDTIPPMTATESAMLPLLRQLLVPLSPRNPFQNLGINTGLGLGHGQQFQDVVVHATQAQIDAGSSVQTLATNHDGICAVCQDQMRTGEDIRHLTACNHDFHRSCIDNWLLQRSVLCPTCRHDIRDRVTASGPQPQPQPQQVTPVPPTQEAELDLLATSLIHSLFGTGGPGSSRMYR